MPVACEVFFWLVFGEFSFNLFDLLKVMLEFVWNGFSESGFSFFARFDPLSLKSLRIETYESPKLWHVFQDNPQTKRTKKSNEKRK